MRKHIVSLMVVTFFALSMCVGAQAEQCGKCHSDLSAYGEWQTSGHAKALKTLLKAKNARQSCLKCHSADYELARINPWISKQDLPKVKEVKDSVSCSLCHKHKNKDEVELRKPIEKLCTDCHVLFCGG